MIARIPVLRRWSDRRLGLMLAQIGLVISVCGAVFGRDVFRFGGYSPGPGVELVLQGVRGVLFLCGKYLVYPLAVAAWLLGDRRPDCISTAERVRGAWRFWLFLGYLAVAAGLSPFPEAMLSRATLFGTYILPALVALMVLGILNATERLHSGILIFAAINLVVLGASGQLRSVLAGDILEANVTENERLAIQSDTISTAVNFYFFGLAGLLAAFGRGRGWLCRLGGLGMLVVSVGLALFTGSRGPLISFVLAGLMLLVIQQCGLVLKFFQAGSLVLGLAVGCSLLPFVAPESNERLLSAAAQVVPGFASEGDFTEGITADERFGFYEAVVASKPTLLGHGIGSFGDYVHQSDEYVHNLFLEAYFEMGIVGLLLLIWLVAVGFAMLLRAYLQTQNEGVLFCLIALVFFVTEAQFSGTLLGNKGFLPFLLLGYCAAAGIGERGMPRQLLKLKSVRNAIPQNLDAVPRVP